MNTYQVIVVPVDGSILADLAFQKAKDYALKNHAKLIVFNVVDAANVYGIEYNLDLDPAFEASKKLVQGYAKDLKNAQVEYETFSTVGKAKVVILETVKEYHADAIFMGSSGVNAITRLIIGSTTEYIIRHSPVDLVTVKTHLDNRTRPTH